MVQVEYDNIIQYGIDKNVFNLQGNIIEIGCFIGNGTVKLCKLGKKVYVIDVFNPDFDTTITNLNVPISSMYHNILGENNQFEKFKINTKDYNNIKLFKQDSKTVKLLKTDIFCFAFIDGGHTIKDIKNDMDLVWNNLVSNGIMCVHDYGMDLPHITDEVNKFIEKHKLEILEHEIIGNMIMGITKK